MKKQETTKKGISKVKAAKKSEKSAKKAIKKPSKS